VAGALNRGLWQLSRLAERAGTPGVAAAALLLATLLAWAAWYLPMTRERTELQAGIDRQRHAQAARLDRSTKADRAAPRGTLHALAEFTRELPDDDRLSPVFERVWTIARQHGLPLQQAEFKLSRPAAQGYGRYTITLPVKAEYAVLRQFVNDVLRDVPSIALEELSLKRDDTRRRELDVRLSFVVFVAHKD